MSAGILSVTPTALNIEYFAGVARQPSITALAGVQYSGDKVLKCFLVNALQLQTDDDKPHWPDIVITGRR